MPLERTYAVRLLGLLLLAGLAAGAAVYSLPEGWVRWIPALVGAGWTGGLVWLVRRMAAEPGAPEPASIRAGVVACGLLTALAASWAVRDTVGWPELALVAGALVAFAFWMRNMKREIARQRAFPPLPPGPILGLGERGPDRPDPTRPQSPPRSSRRTTWM